MQRRAFVLASITSVIVGSIAFACADFSGTDAPNPGAEGGEGGDVPDAIAPDGAMPLVDATPDAITEAGDDDAMDAGAPDASQGLDAAVLQGLTAYFPFENKPDDLVGAHPLSWTGTAPIYVAGAVGMGAKIDANNALQRPVEDDLFDCFPNSTSDIPDNEKHGWKSMQVWVRLTTTPGASLAPILTKAQPGDPDNGGYVFGVRGTTLAWTSANGAVGLAAAPPTVVLGATYHLVLLCPALPINGAFYVNGVKVADPHSTTQDSLARLRVGTDGTTNLDGMIDELAFWDRELTAAEVTALYNGGKGQALK